MPGPSHFSGATPLVTCHTPGHLQPLRDALSNLFTRFISSPPFNLSLPDIRPSFLRPHCNNISLFVITYWLVSLLSLGFPV